MEEKFYFVSDEKERAELRAVAEKLAKKDRGFLLYRVIFALISLFFLLFFAYTLVLIVQSEEGFQLQSLILLAVPLIGAALPFEFVRQKRQKITEDICEDADTYLTFAEDRIIVHSLHKKRGENSLFTWSMERNPARKQEEYEIELAQLRFYAYDETTGKFRWISGKTDHADIVAPNGASLKRIMDELEKRGVRRTKFLA